MPSNLMRRCLLTRKRERVLPAATLVPIIQRLQAACIWRRWLERWTSQPGEVWMVARPQNLLVIMSDEHNRKIAGYAGHPIVRTPALDALAARGTWFTVAYTPSPICVPARASLATGLPVHRHRAWDNATAYDGRIQGWAHALRKRGHHVASIGKLHYRGHPDEDYGLTESLLAMHITGGVGDVTHLVRDPDDIRTTGKNLIASAGPGESSYTLLTGRLLQQRRSGCARQPRAGMRALGCCLSRWWHRIFRSPHRRNISTDISARICRARNSTIKRRDPTIPTYGFMRSDRITIGISTAR